MMTSHCGNDEPSHYGGTMLRDMTFCCAILLSACSASNGISSTTTPLNGASEPVRCSLSIDHFALSDALDSPQSPVEWNAVDRRYLHVFVKGTELPDNVSTLQAGYRLLNNSSDEGRYTSKPESGGYFEVTISRGALDPNQAYLIRVSDNFGSPLCMAAHSIRTKPAQ
jgi:hypothetical protein